MDAEAQQRLRRNLALADEDALVALANRGLYRRALKDLEQSPEIAIEETEKSLLIRGPGWCVTMPPEGPAAARDDSGATGLTRFVIMATLYLRDHWLATNEPTNTLGATRTNNSVGEPSTLEVNSETPPGFSSTTTNGSKDLDDVLRQLLTSTIEELVSWSGKGNFLRATAKLKSIRDFKIERVPTISFVFSGENKRVFLMSDRPEKNLKKLLSQFLITTDKAELSFWVVLAVLALKREHGEDHSNVNVLEAEISAAIQQDRQLVAQRCLKLFTATTLAGIAHPSSRIVERFETMAVSAEAASFPRLARLLKGLANDIQLQIARSAAADRYRMLDRLLVAYAVCKAANATDKSVLTAADSTLRIAESTANTNSPSSNPKARPELYGRVRSQYIQEGTLDLYGLGTYAWQTDSGYQGVTSMFWDNEHRRFLTASQARGEGQDPNFSFESAYNSPLTWKNSQSLKIHCRQHIRLEEPKVNSEGRLSASESCMLTVVGKVALETIDFGDRLAEEWPQVIERARCLQPLGLRTITPTDSFIIAKPTYWGKRWFDELEQEFVWELFDTHGRKLELRVPWLDHEQSSIHFLESIRPDQENLWAILARITVNRSRVVLYPISLLSSGNAKGATVICPHFDRDLLSNPPHNSPNHRHRNVNTSRNIATKIVEADEEGGVAPDLLGVPQPISDLLLHLERIVHSTIETGAVSLNHLAVEQIVQGEDLAEALGLQSLSKSIRNLTSIIQRQGDNTKTESIPLQSRHTTELANVILELAYATRLTRQAAANLALQT